MTVQSLRSVEEGTVFDADLCVVGAGPVGIALVLRFAGSDVRVCLLESGGPGRDTEAEELHAIESVGLRRAPQESTRSRGLGGTSLLWSGRCGVFDAIDYAARSWVPHSGWPIDAADVAPHLDEAGQLLGLGPALYSDRVLDRLSAREPERPWDEHRFLPVVWQYSQHAEARAEAVRELARAGVPGAEHIGALQHAGAPRPRNFGEAYGPRLDAAPNVRVLLHATALCVDTDPTGGRAVGVTVSTLEGRKAIVRAPRVVVACGGVENARLLLASRGVHAEGVGNAHGQVGRYLMDHPYAELGAYEGPGSEGLRRRFGSRWLDWRGARHVYQLGLRLHPTVQRAEGLLNAQVHLVELGDRPSAVSAAGKAVREVRAKGLTLGAARELAQALASPAELAVGAVDRYVKRRPALAPSTRVQVSCVPEQVPDPESRITLSERRDRLGVPLARVDWRAAEQELRTIRRMRELLTAELTRLGYPLPTPADWLDQGVDAYRARIHDMAHPMGTTRMAADPRRGVVDADGAVFGIEGLYVAGTSTFSTAGYMNPTLMAVALTLRLATHLQRSLTRVASVSTERPSRVGLIGAGRRVQGIYLPVLEALGDELEVVGVTSARPERARALAASRELPAFESAAALVEQARPDFLVVAVASDAVDAVVPGLVELGVPLLLETPFCWDVRRGRALLARIEALGLTVGVAEQTPFLPLEQMKRKLVELGLVGRVVAVHNDFAVYDYHGLAAARAHLSRAARPRLARATRHAIGGPGSDEHWTLAHVEHDDGSLLVHHYGPAYFDSPVRGPRTLRVHGTTGGIVDDELRVQTPSGSASVSRIVREHDDGRLVALSVDTPLGPVRWQNPFAAHALDDEQVAVATLLTAMRRAVRFGGAPAWSAREGLEDIELLGAIRFSCLREGAATPLPLHPRLEQLRSVAPSKAREKARRILGRR